MKIFNTVLLFLLGCATFLKTSGQTSSSQCFVSPSTPSTVFAKSTWTTNSDGSVTIRTTFAKTFVDNTYGTNSIGWGSKGHDFKELVGSDHIQLALYDAGGTKRSEFKLDYITASNSVSSGYKTLGVSGGDGKMISGSAADIVNVKTSISENFNTYGYVLSSNSPATNSSYAVNSTYPNWIYDVWYEVTVKKSAFGSSGFGYPRITEIHASPSKTGHNSEEVKPGDCPPPPAQLTLGNLVWNDVNGNGIKEADEAGVGGVNIRLYRDNNGDNKADSETPIATTVTAANGTYMFTGLAAGKYIAGLIIPSGYTVPPNRFGNPDNNVDNDNNAINVVNKESEVRSNFITLSAGAEPDNDGDGKDGNLTLDLAICGRADLGDFVFNDLNGNGIQDANEPGIPNVKVTLTYPDGTTTSRTTNAEGKYLFVNLGTGVHKVTFTTPGGFTPSPANQGGNDAKDSDPVNGVVSVTMAANVDNLTIDAGFTKATPPAQLTLGNLVWNDVNGNGIKEADEAGVGGVTVRLYTDNNGDNKADSETPIKTTVTEANGTYKFTGLSEGKYIAGLIIPSGYTVPPTRFGNPNNNVDNDNNAINVVNNEAEVRSNFITLSAGDEPDYDGDGKDGNLTLDLAICGRSDIGDFVWHDLNSNGIQDAGEPGIPNVKVTLTYPDGTTTSKNTDADGKYIFVNLGPGIHKLSFTTPAGYSPAPANQGSDDAKDSDPVNGVVTVTIVANVNNFTYDAGFTKTVAKLRLGNQVWNDRDGDGKRDTNEPGIPGVTISLYTDNNSDNLPDGAAIKTTMSDDMGRYLFTDLPEGRYIASMLILPGYQQSPNNTTGGIVGAPKPGCCSLDPDADKDNDNNLVRLVGPNGPGGVVYTNAITLTANQEPTSDGDDANGNLTFDLAECGNSFIGDFVWNDLNGNGIQDAGEPGLNGVLVTLTFSDGTIATETTHKYEAANNQNAPQYDGYYDFKNLGPGTYKITFETPAGLHSSPANQGNDAKDSDPVNGGPVFVTLAANESNFTIDAGFTNVTPPPTCPNLSLGNMVYYDANVNGVRDASEQGIGGLTVNLYKDDDANNVADGPAISTLMTADDGTYYFGNLAAGRYIVGVVTGGTYVMGNNGKTNPDDNKDNDNNGVTTVNGEVRSNAITLTAGDEPINDGSDNNSNLTLDFGLKKPTDKSSARAAVAIESPEVATTTISAFPNPANSYITLKVMAKKGGTGVARLTDASGKIIATKKANFVSGLNLLNFDQLQGLKSGNYFIQLSFDYHVYNEQVIVVR